MAVKIMIDGQEISAKEGSSVLTTALNAGIYIPHICSHPDLENVGECKLCVVNIEGIDDAVTACTTIVQDGMRVTTKNAHLEHLRRVAMEFMLAGHPHDCTSCKMYLKCELQAMMQYTNAVHGRLRDVTKATTMINTHNPLIVREMERCIQCGRCVRVCRDVRGVGILQMNKYEKNNECYIGTEEDRSLAEANCRFCSACVEVCPTGALQDAEGVFQKELPGKLALIPCSAECPAHTDIPEYVRLVAEGRYAEASAVIHEKLPFPKSLGRVCIHPCEKACKRSRLNDPISVRNLKRFAVEADTEKAWKQQARQSPDTGKRVAVVGGGPAGMTAALYLRKQGHAVTVFEQYPNAGGYLRYGIPAYRLPREAVQDEINDILETGVELRTGFRVENVESLRADGFDAVVLAMGTPLGKAIPLPGVELGHNITAADFLHRVSAGEDCPEIHGKKVIVLGGGNVAFDAARSAVRLGAEVSMFCLEPRDGMLADEEEVTQAAEEGIQLHNSTTNIAILGTEEKLEGLRYAEISGFAFGSDGLKVDVIPDTEKVEPGELIIFALGQKTDIPKDFGVELNRFGYPEIVKGTHRTTLEYIFAAGDVVTGTKSVIEAVAAGRAVASECDIYLGGDGNIDEVLYTRTTNDPKIGQKDKFSQLPREIPSIEPQENRQNSFIPVEYPLTAEQAQCEAARCLQCDLRCDLNKVKMWTEY